MNYNKEKFLNILDNLKNFFGSQNKMAEALGLSSSYITKIYDENTKNPPAPEYLQKIAANSKGITTYNELMKICGYIENIHSFDTDAFTRSNELKTEILSLEKDYSDLNLNDEEQKILENYKIQKENLQNEYSNLSNNDKSYQDMSATRDWYMKENDKILYSVLHTNSKNIRKDFISKALKILNRIDSKKSFIESYEVFLNNNNNTLMVAEDSAPYSTSNTIKIPVVGTVAAGEPILAEQNIIDYEELPANEFQDGEYFRFENQTEIRCFLVFWKEMLL